MAALIRHASLAIPGKCTAALLASNTATPRYDSRRWKSKKRTQTVAHSYEAEQTSLATKGFLRYHEPYKPPKDVSTRIDKICETQEISNGNTTKLEDPVQRYKLFLACEEELKHAVPNSVLYSIETVGDLKDYYQTPVGSATPLDSLRSMELPKNLHINYDYVRFHPDTDTMFNGKTAFPKSSTLVTGLKYKKKYIGHKQEDPYLEELLKI